MRAGLCGAGSGRMGTPCGGRRSDAVRRPNAPRRGRVRLCPQGVPIPGGRGRTRFGAAPRWPSIAAIVAGCLLLAGCFELDESFVLNSDGSGSLRARIKIIPQLARFDESEGLAEHDLPFFTEEEVREWGRAEGLKVREAEVRDTPDGGKIGSFLVEFDDIHKFARSGVARHFAFALERSAYVGQTSKPTNCLSKSRPPAPALFSAIA